MCDFNTTGVPGDFENERTSVNDPVFFFVHAAFDALFDDWRRAYDERHRQLRKTHQAPAPARSPAASSPAAEAILRLLRADLDVCARRQPQTWTRHRFAPWLTEDAPLRALLALQRADDEDEDPKRTSTVPTTAANSNSTGNTTSNGTTSTSAAAPQRPPPRDPKKNTTQPVRSARLPPKGTQRK